MSAYAGSREGLPATRRAKRYLTTAWDGQDVQAEEEAS